jgi:hypothetical protein
MRTDHEQLSNRELSMKHSYPCSWYCQRRGATSSDRMAGHLSGFALLLLLSFGALVMRAVPLLNEQSTTRVARAAAKAPHHHHHSTHRLNHLGRQNDDSQRVTTKAGTAVSTLDILDLRLLHRSPPEPEYVGPVCLPSFLADLVSGCVSLASHPPPLKI